MTRPDPELEMIYTVTARAKHPAWDERDGIVYREIFASSKAAAVTIARRRHQNAGHAGVWYFTAELEG